MFVESNPPCCVLLYPELFGSLLVYGCFSWDLGIMFMYLYNKFYCKSEYSCMNYMMYIGPRVVPDYLLISIGFSRMVKVSSDIFPVFSFHVIFGNGIAQNLH